MQQRAAFIGAVALTAFFLVVIAQLGVQIAQTPPVVQPTEVAPAPAELDPADQAILAEREAAYQAALRSANERLALANAEIAKANQHVELVRAQTAQAESGSAAAVMQPSQAKALAQAVAGGLSPLRAPELVQFDGALAYEVVFSTGAVYIDATTGRVMFDQTSQPAQSAGSDQQRQGDDEHGHDQEREHEQEQGDDD